VGTEGWSLIRLFARRFEQFIGKTRAETVPRCCWLLAPDSIDPSETYVRMLNGAEISLMFSTPYNLIADSLPQRAAPLYSRHCWKLNL
jgi:hypothetical protein